MKKLIILIPALFCLFTVYSQKTNIYQSGVIGEENLKAIANLGPNTVGGIGFDTRYEGIKGTTRLFDTLVASYLLVKGQEKYIQFNSDLDIVKNTLLFAHPSTGKLMEIPSDDVIELIVMKDGKELVFKTTKGINFKKKIEGNKFYMVLKEGPHQFIRIPEKNFIEADYKAAYSADRRYDEFKPVSRYFIEDSNNVFQQIQLNRKSLIKMFPEKKELINKEFQEKPDADNEEKVISIINKF